MISSYIIYTDNSTLPSITLNVSELLARRTDPRLRIMYVSYPTTTTQECSPLYIYVYVHPANGVRLKDLRPSTDQLAREQRAYKAFSTIMKSPPIFYRKGCSQSRTPLAQSLDKTHTVGFPTPPSYFGKNKKKGVFFWL